MSVATFTQNNPGQTPEEGWQALAISLVENLRENSTYLKTEDRDELHRELDEVLRVLRDQPSESVLQITTETVSQKLTEYFLQTQKEIDNSFGELRQMASVLMGALTQIDENDQTITTSLSEIGNLVQSARSPGELAVAKIHLVQALERLRSHTESRRDANQQLLSTLQERAHLLELAPTLEATLRAKPGDTGTAAGQGITALIGSTDPVTGLPGRQAGEAYLMSLPDKSKANSYVVAFYVQRMELINSRFGDRMGTDVLCYSAQCFAKLLQLTDQLFRWRGPGFVAVLTRGRSLSDVKLEVNSVYRTRITFEGADNSVIIPLSIVTQVWSARKSHAAELIQNVETFFSLPDTRATLEATAESDAESVDLPMEEQQ
ncbi:MAG: diguanylate cyclase [Bryobacteraceae bacterium]